jgi:isocitrate/isopropylmalate dehydrogenase
VANPAALMLGTVMLLDHAGEADAARRMYDAIVATIARENVRTRDLGGSASTADFARAVARRL